MKSSLSCRSASALLVFAMTGCQQSPPAGAGDIGIHDGKRPARDDHGRRDGATVAKGDP